MKKIQEIKQALTQDEVLNNEQAQHVKGGHCDDKRRPRPKTVGISCGISMQA